MGIFKLIRLVRVNKSFLPLEDKQCGFLLRFESSYNSDKRILKLCYFGNRMRYTSREKEMQMDINKYGKHSIVIFAPQTESFFCY